ncbi:hypothetical protein, partial [Parasediminibacterium sp. JCM 36343]|uniref:hypothetical protein n=1 Tax=Parasediminibacterium sp. JCM 36343 TaxID=3374279 RepID=UPI00397B352C
MAGNESVFGMWLKIALGQPITKAKYLFLKFKYITYCPILHGLPEQKLRKGRKADFVGLSQPYRKYGC